MEAEKRQSRTSGNRTERMRIAGASDVPRGDRRGARVRLLVDAVFAVSLLSRTGLATFARNPG
jgi:hypothetical protein